MCPPSIQPMLPAVHILMPLSLMFLSYHAASGSIADGCKPLVMAASSISIVQLLPTSTLQPRAASSKSSGTAGRFSALPDDAIRPLYNCDTYIVIWSSLSFLLFYPNHRGATLPQCPPHVSSSTWVLLLLLCVLPMAMPSIQS